MQDMTVVWVVCQFGVFLQSNKLSVVGTLFIKCSDIKNMNKNTVRTDGTHNTPHYNNYLIFICKKINYAYMHSSIKR